MTAVIATGPTSGIDLAVKRLLAVCEGLPPFSEDRQRLLREVEQLRDLGRRIDRGLAGIARQA